MSGGRFLLAEAERLGLLGHWHPDSRRAEGHTRLPRLDDRGFYQYAVLFAEVKTAGCVDVGF